MITAITGARVFDGDQVTGARTVVVDGAGIAAVGGPRPPAPPSWTPPGGPCCPA